MTGSQVRFGDVRNGATVQHPVARCVEREAAHQFRLRRVCKLDGIHFGLTISTEDSGKQALAETLLRETRFTALEEACLAKTGKACP
jgi:hypothetical protein